MTPPQVWEETAHMDERQIYRVRYQLRQATNRFIEGARLTRDRILSTTADAPTPLVIGGVPVKNLVGLRNNDLDYYVFELARLQEVAQETVQLFGADEVRQA